MTGKSELTGSLRDRLADALRVATIDFSPRSLAPSVSPSGSDGLASTGHDLPGYLRDDAAIRATLASLPRGDDGRRLKRAFLDLLEEIAVERALPLDAHVFDLRREVVNGER